MSDQPTSPPPLAGGAKGEGAAGLKPDNPVLLYLRRLDEKFDRVIERLDD
jgi:hypothetical protein